MPGSSPQALLFVHPVRACLSLQAATSCLCRFQCHCRLLRSFRTALVPKCLSSPSQPQPHELPVSKTQVWQFASHSSQITASLSQPAAICNHTIQQVYFVIVAPACQLPHHCPYMCEQFHTLATWQSYTQFSCLICYWPCAFTLLDALPISCVSFTTPPALQN